MYEFPTLNNEQIIELAKNVADAFVSTNESMKQASVDEFLEVYLDVFALACSKVEKRVNDRDKKTENYDDCEKLPKTPIR